MSRSLRATIVRDVLLFVTNGPVEPPDALEKAWDEIHLAKPAGWWVGPPSFHVERNEGAMYAFDTTERAKVERRSREWTAVAPTQIRVVREIARCLQEIRDGRVPK